MKFPSAGWFSQTFSSFSNPGDFGTLPAESSGRFPIKFWHHIFKVPEPWDGDMTKNIVNNKHFGVSFTGGTKKRSNG
jgi:hypothetical protein